MLYISVKRTQRRGGVDGGQWCSEPLLQGDYVVGGDVVGREKFTHQSLVSTEVFGSLLYIYILKLGLYKLVVCRDVRSRSSLSGGAYRITIFVLHLFSVVYATLPLLSVDR